MVLHMRQKTFTSICLCKQTLLPTNTNFLDNIIVPSVDTLKNHIFGLQPSNVDQNTAIMQYI